MALVQDIYDGTWIYMMAKKVSVCELSFGVYGVYICYNFLCVCVCVHVHWSYEMGEKHLSKYNLCPLVSLASPVF